MCIYFNAHDYLYYWLQNMKTTETAIEETSTASGDGKDVWLGNDSSESIYDTQRAPLVNFHHYEQLHQKTSSQVGYFFEKYDI